MSSVVGIRSFGFNCFINSGLQCLIHLEPFKDYITNNPKEIIDIIKDKFKYESERNEEDDEEDENIVQDKKKWLVYINFKNIMIRLCDESTNCVDPLHFIMSCRNQCKDNVWDHLFNGDHQDISEFIQYLIDFLHELKGTELQQLKIKDDNEPMSCDEKIINDFLKCCRTFYSKKFSWFIKKMCFFQINKINCNQCSYMTTSYDPNNILFLTIPDSKELTLFDCMDNYFGKEIMTDNDWKCDSCGNKRDNYREFRLVNAPSILMICLKRTIDHNNSGNYTKENTKVIFPLILNIDKYLIKLNSNSPKNYQLMSISNHYGRIDSGHYISICKKNDKWYRFDDETVTEIDTKDIITSNAYMLFYQQI